jgi:hypothetical protein
VLVFRVRWCSAFPVPVVSYWMPFVARSLITWAKVEPLDPGARRSPFQLPAALPDEVNVIFSAAVPTALTLPSTCSSALAVFTPQPIRSVVANESVTPGSITRFDPAGTRRSPATV